MILPDNMKAAVCTGPGAALEVQRVPVPQPAAGEYLVQLESCGVCHSDLHLRDGDEQLPENLYPLIFGHEGIGRIVAGVGPLDIGTRVGLPWLYDTCLVCKPCMTGAETYCSNQHVRGIAVTGGFAEFALSDIRFTCPIPDEIDSAAGAPLLCAGLTSWSAIAKTKVKPGSRVLVIGAGGLGQYAILIAKAHGARVVVIDQDSEKLKQAKILGSEHCFLAGPDAGRSVQESGGADVVLNFAPSSTVWNTIEAAVNTKSDIVSVALVYESVPLSMMWLIDGGHRLFGSSVGTRSELRDFLQFAADHRLSIPVETLPLSEVNTALDRLADGSVLGRLCVDFAL